MNDKEYMRRAIQLARCGYGWTNPNPMVGAVIVKDGRILAEGYHHRCGQLHAERDALAKLKEDASGATMYVTLEPCCHYGKQPPCTKAIVEHGIAKVVIGSRDPNPKVAGKGVLYLREHGVMVEEDFLREECDAINDIFFHYITTNTPYVTLKYAMTLDGKIATKTGESQWISNEKSRAYVHAMRGQYAAILVGIGTVLADNPSLNCRDIQAAHLEEANPDGIHQPVRMVMDRNLRIPADSKLVATAKQQPLLVFTGGLTDEALHKKALLTERGVEVIEIPDSQGRPDWQQMIRIMAQRQLDSLLIEGGGTIAESALAAGIVQRVETFIAPTIVGGSTALSPVEGEGVSQLAKAYALKLLRSESLEGDLHAIYQVVSRE